MEWQEWQGVKERLVVYSVEVVGKVDTKQAQGNHLLVFHILEVVV